MNTNNLKRISRIDKLIKLKATGTPKIFAKMLGISERTLYDVIKDMKELGAPVYYSPERQSYCYKHNVEFVFGFVDAE